MSSLRGPATPEPGQGGNQHFLEPIPLGHIVAGQVDLPEGTWLYIAAGTSPITLDTACHPTAVPPHELGPGQDEELEAHASSAGLRCFLCMAQLEDIAENLKAQCPSPGPGQLAAAIDFYWKHDAFIDLSTRSPYDEALTQLVCDAIVQSVRDIGIEAPGEALAAYAICTDDDLLSVFGVATTRAYVEREEDASARYGAVEFPYGYGSSAFDLVRAKLLESFEALGQGDAFPRHVETCFGSLVEALRRSRAAGTFAEDVLTYACGTDPGEHLEALEAAAVIALNSPECQRHWESAHGPLPRG